MFSAKYTTDLDVAYQLFDNTTLSIGGRNIFDVYPDTIANGVFPATGGLIDGEKYPRTGGPFGFNGRFLYVRARFTF